MFFLKLVLLFSGAAALLIRLFAFENSEAMTAGLSRGLNSAGLAFAAVFLVCGIVLILYTHKNSKKK